MQAISSKQSIDCMIGNSVVLFWLAGRNQFCNIILLVSVIVIRRKSYRILGPLLREM